MRQASAPIHKITLNIYSADREWLQARYGQGWTETVREMIHQRVENEKRMEKQ